MIELIKNLLMEPFKYIVRDAKDKVKKIKIAMIILYIAVMLNLLFSTIILVIVAVK